MLYLCFKYMVSTVNLKLTYESKPDHFLVLAVVKADVLDTFLMLTILWVKSNEFYYMGDCIFLT